MWFRLIAWVLIASALTAWVAPIDRFYVYCIVIGVGLPLFALRLDFKKPKPSPQKPANVIHMEDYRHKKNQEQPQQGRKR